MLAFDFIPKGVKANGDNVIWIGALCGGFAMMIALWRQVRKWRPIAGSIDKAKAVVIAVWRILFGSPIENSRRRHAERYITPIVEAVEERIMTKLDEQTAINTTQHDDDRKRSEAMDKRITQIDTRVGAIAIRLGMAEEHIDWPERSLLDEPGGN